MVQLLSWFAAVNNCDTRPFFLLPSWYEYLVKAHKMAVVPGTGRCEFVQDFQVPDLALIGLALLDIALRIAGMVAVGYIIWGGIQFVTSQGEPDQSKRARQTIINALIGLLIALMATGFVAFIGTKLG